MLSRISEHSRNQNFTSPQEKNKSLIDVDKKESPNLFANLVLIILKAMTSLENISCKSACLETEFKCWLLVPA